ASTFCHKLFNMNDSNLCEFCCGLIFSDEDDHNFYRTLKEVQYSVETRACPFCKAFYDSLSTEHPDAEANTQCKFRLNTFHYGFIQLTIFFCPSLLGTK